MLQMKSLKEKVYRADKDDNGSTMEGKLVKQLRNYTIPDFPFSVRNELYWQVFLTLRIRIERASL
jgi:hypothetical protein